MEDCGIFKELYVIYGNEYFFINICKFWFFGKGCNSYKYECVVVFYLLFRNFYKSIYFLVVLSEY